MKGRVYQRDNSDNCVNVQHTTLPVYARERDLQGKEEEASRLHLSCVSHLNEWESSLHVKLLEVIYDTTLALHIHT